MHVLGLADTDSSQIGEPSGRFRGIQVTAVSIWLKRVSWKTRSLSFSERIIKRSRAESIDHSAIFKCDVCFSNVGAIWCFLKLIFPFKCLGNVTIMCILTAQHGCYKAVNQISLPMWHIEESRLYLSWCLNIIIFLYCSVFNDTESLEWNAFELRSHSLSMIVDFFKGILVKCFALKL